MKNYLTVLALCALVSCLPSCKKEKPFSAYNSYYKYGITTAKINGGDFSSQTSISGNDTSFPGLSIANVKFNGDIEIPAWKFIIYNIRKTLGRQKLYQAVYSDTHPFVTFGALYHYDGGWDASCGDYWTIDADSLTNYIEITNQKDNYKEIWGKFNVTVYVETVCQYNPMPDTIRITDGSFHLFPPDKNN